MASVDGVQQRLAARPGRPRRADAQRSLIRLIEAAQLAVHESGLEVTSHDIAARAGVGVGTFYRQVGSRQGLLEAVLTDLLTDIAAVADRALEHPDPWTGFTDFAETYVQLRVASCGVNEALGAVHDLDLATTIHGLQDRLRRLVERAALANQLRTDVTWQDVAFLLAAVVPTTHTLGLTADEHQWRRTLRVTLDGLARQPS